MFPQEETPAFPLPPCNWLSPPHVVTSLGLIIHAAVPPLLEKPFRYNISFEFRGANNSDPRCCCKERQLLLDETTHSSVYVCESKLFKCAEYIWHHTPVVFKKKKKAFSTRVECRQKKWASLHPALSNAKSVPWRVTRNTVLPLPKSSRSASSRLSGEQGK